ncbi:hypothetical protein, partial [Janthinobacterium lividum]|uniref:hypothetical protein n=1 Tax=Janthinobacterium lividum TaxID=29581 RepID=UPI001CB9A223
INEVPYRIDRMLCQLDLSVGFNKAAAMPLVGTSGVTGVDGVPSGKRVCVVPRASLLWNPFP